MCIAVPGKVMAIDGVRATVDMLGNTTYADLSVLTNVKIGDYVLVHAGMAIQKYQEEEALLNLELFKELLGVMESDPVVSSTER